MYTKLTSAVGAATLGIIGGFVVAVITKKATFQLETSNRTRRWGKDAGNDDQS